MRRDRASLLNFRTSPLTPSKIEAVLVRLGEVTYKNGCEIIVMRSNTRGCGLC